MTIDSINCFGAGLIRPNKFLRLIWGPPRFARLLSKPWPFECNLNGGGESGTDGIWRRLPELKISKHKIRWGVIWTIKSGYHLLNGFRKIFSCNILTYRFSGEKRKSKENLSEKNNGPEMAPPNPLGTIIDNSDMSANSGNLNLPQTQSIWTPSTTGTVLH